MRLITRVAGLLSLAALIPVAASAQATRTWVSGVGNDANPCSRTAPCKTFAGAISKTATAGEINVLDPGAFGAVTITKSITISSEYTEAGVLASGTNGIIVNAAGVNVTLRGLDIEGLGAGLNGIRFIAGNSLRVENCTIHAFTQQGISFEPNTASAQLTVLNTIISASANGINVVPVAGGSAKVALDHVQLMGNALSGLNADASNGAVQVAAQGSLSQANLNGFRAFASTTGTANVVLDDCSAVQNSGNGVLADTGANATIRFMSSSITGNGIGANIIGSGKLASLKNSLISGNGVDIPGGVTVSVITPQ